MEIFIKIKLDKVLSLIYTFPFLFLSLLKIKNNKKKKNGKEKETLKVTTHFNWVVYLPKKKIIAQKLQIAGYFFFQL